MNYLFDVKKLENLLFLEGEIYDGFKLVSGLEKETDSFYHTVGNLRKLSLEESSFISFFPESISYLKRICALARVFYLSKTLDKDKAKFVLLRFDNLIDSRCASIDEKFDSFDIAYYEKISFYNEIKKHYNTCFIRKLCTISSSSDDLFKFTNNLGIMAAYSIKDISDELILNNFDISSFENVSSIDMIKKLDVDSDMYMSMYYELLYDECMDVLSDLVVNYDFYYDNKAYVNIAYNVSLLRFLLVNVADIDFLKIRSKFNDDLSNLDFDSSSTSIIDSIFESVNDERYSSIIGECSSENCLDGDVVSNLISLFRLEKTILGSSSNLDSLLEFESDLKNSIYIDENNVNIILDMIDNDLKFFIDVDEKELYLIKSRLFNLFSEFHDMCPCIISGSYNMILSNHVVRTLDNFSCDEVTFKEILYMYPDLNDEFLMSYSDEMSGILLGLKSKLDYSYDKNEQLYYLGVKLIDELCLIENNSLLKSIFEFKIMEFNDIIDNVSDENLFLLREKVLNSSLSVKNKFEKFLSKHYVRKEYDYGKRCW